MAARKPNRWGCKPTEDVCVEHDLPLQCRHGCEEAKPHACAQKVRHQRFTGELFQVVVVRGERGKHCSSGDLVRVLVEDDGNYFPRLEFDSAWLGDLETQIHMVKKWLAENTRGT